MPKRRRIKHGSGTFRCETLLKIENVFLVFWLICGLTIAVFTPPGVGKDEECHVARAEQIAEGQFLPQKVDVRSVDERILYVPEQYRNLDLYGGKTDKALYDLLALRYPSVNESEVASMNFARPWWSDSRYSVEGRMGQGKVEWAFPNTSVNSPLSYLPFSLGYNVSFMFGASPILCVILMRVFGVVAYGLIVRFAIKKTPICKKSMFLIAILPNCIAVSTVVSADMMTNACVFLFFAFVLRFLVNFQSTSRCDYVWIGVSLVCLSLLKMPYVTFGLLLILIFVINKMWKKKHATLKIATIGSFALVCFFAWSSCTKGIATYTVWDIQNIDSSAQIAFMFQHPLTAFKAIFGQLCETDLGLVEMTAYAVNPIPVWLTIFACICFVAQDIKTCPPLKRCVLISASLLAVCFLIAILVIVALYLTFAPVGATSYAGVQSRYFVPVLFPIFVAITLLLKTKNSKVEKVGIVNLSAIALLVIYGVFAFHAYSVWLF